MRAPALLLGLALALSANAASAQTVETATRTSTASVRPEDARGLVERDRFEPEDYALFLPRLLLLPPRLALSLVTWPLRKGLVLVERYHVVEHIEDLLYNDARTAGVLPAITGFPGVGTSFGVNVFHDDLLGHGESLSVSAAYGGLYQQAYRVKLEADHVLDGRLWFEGEASYEAKPNLYFRGIGDPASADAGVGLDPYAAAVETRFSEQRYLTRFRMGTRHGRPGQLLEPGISVIYNHRRFDEGERLRAGDLDLTRVYDEARIPGFLEGADILEITADLVLDYRNEPARPSSGFLVEAFAGGVPRQGKWRYFHWGVEASGYLELWAKERVLVLRGVLEAVEGDRERIPFTELPRLGGPRRLRGYRLNSFRDEKAVLGTVEYRWHVHQYVTASLFVDVGQVRDGYLELFSVGEGSGWRAGYGGGLRIGSRRTTLVNIDIAYGDGLQVLVSTEPLEAFADRTEQL